MRVRHLVVPHEIKLYIIILILVGANVIHSIGLIIKVFWEVDKPLLITISIHLSLLILLHSLWFLLIGLAVHRLVVFIWLLSLLNTKGNNFISLQFWAYRIWVFAYQFSWYFEILDIFISEMRAILPYRACLSCICLITPLRLSWNCVIILFNFSGFFYLRSRLFTWSLMIGQFVLTGFGDRIIRFVV